MKDDLPTNPIPMLHHLTAVPPGTIVEVCNNRNRWLRGTILYVVLTWWPEQSEITYTIKTARGSIDATAADMRTPRPVRGGPACKKGRRRR